MQREALVAWTCPSEEFTPTAKVQTFVDLVIFGGPAGDTKNEPWQTSLNLGRNHGRGAQGLEIL